MGVPSRARAQGRGSLHPHVLVWLMLLVWLTVAFASFFTSLFAEPYGHAIDMPGGCVDPDTEFENILTVAQVLFEISLSGDGRFACFAATSVPETALPAIYLFVILSCVVLTNMLSACRALDRKSPLHHHAHMRTASEPHIPCQFFSPIGFCSTQSR